MIDDVLLTEPSWVALFVPCPAATVADASDTMADKAIVTIDGTAGAVTIDSQPA